MLARFLFLPAVLVVIWGQLQHGPLPPGPQFSDKLMHFTAYFGLAAMATVALDGTRKIYYAALVLIAMGGLMEIVQGMTGRDAELMDEVANACGVIAGVAAGLAWTTMTGARLAARYMRR